MHKINILNTFTLFLVVLTCFVYFNTVIMPIPLTVNGTRPYITGAGLEDKYEAMSLHFHWGSFDSSGSEHTVKNYRYDAEMHIVHKNVKYATIEEAMQNGDGLAVLGVFLEKIEQPYRIYTAFKEIFNILPQLTIYNSTATIKHQLHLSQFFGDVDVSKFYRYSGSLTTPPCSEAVTWFVFPDSLFIRSTKLEDFFHLKDANGDPMINNFRPLQPLNNRNIFYRIPDLILSNDIY